MTSIPSRGRSPRLLRRPSRRGTFARLDGDVSPHPQPARSRGIFAFGRYGCGKTALLKAIRPLFEPVHFVPLNDPDYAELMDSELWPNWKTVAKPIVEAA